jgi:hypothetical protein
MLSEWGAQVRKLTLEGFTIARLAICRLYQLPVVVDAKTLLSSCTHELLRRVSLIGVKGSCWIR